MKNKKFLKGTSRKIKEIFLAIINTGLCPFQPEDNPFPQSCDKRKWFTDECFKCPWYEHSRGGIEK